jgi:hypothetical protein
MNHSDEHGNVNHDYNLGVEVWGMVVDGDIQKLQNLVADYPELDLSRFPGTWPGHRDGVNEWQNIRDCTPIVLSVVKNRKNIFRFLLSYKVDLEIFFKISVEVTVEDQQLYVPPKIPGVVPPATVKTWLTTNLLGFCVIRPNHFDYLDYANELATQNIQICNTSVELSTITQPLFLLCLNIDKIMILRKLYEDSPSTQFDVEMKFAQGLLAKLLTKELARGSQTGADILMQIFCGHLLPRRMYELNLLGIVMLLLLKNGRHFDIDLYDLNRFYYDKNTHGIFEKLEQAHYHRNVSMAMSLDKNDGSPFSLLNQDLLRKISENAMPKSMEKMSLDECCVCFQKKNLYEVCMNHHLLCSLCRLELARHGGLNCPMCRAKMFGT